MSGLACWVCMGAHSCMEQGGVGWVRVMGMGMGMSMGGGLSIRRDSRPVLGLWGFWKSC